MGRLRRWRRRRRFATGSRSGGRRCRDVGWRGADSLDLLRDAYAEVREAGFTLVNADCVLIGEEPRIAGHRAEMRDRLARALRVEPERVNVRATTTDRLGFSGRGEGLATEAIALLERT